MEHITRNILTEIKENIRKRRNVEKRKRRSELERVFIVRFYCMLLTGALNK